MYDNGDLFDANPPKRELTFLSDRIPVEAIVVFVIFSIVSIVALSIGTNILLTTGTSLSVMSVVLAGFYFFGKVFDIGRESVIEWRMKFYCIPMLLMGVLLLFLGLYQGQQTPLYRGVLISDTICLLW